MPHQVVDWFGDRPLLGARLPVPMLTRAQKAAELQRVAANVFGDFRISTLADGSEVAASPLVGEG